MVRQLKPWRHGGVVIPTERPFLALEIGLNGGNIRRLRCDGFIVPAGRIGHAAVWQATDKLKKYPQDGKSKKSHRHARLLAAIKDNPGQTIRRLSEIVGEERRRTYQELRALEGCGKVQMKSAGPRAALKVYIAEETCQT